MVQWDKGETLPKGSRVGHGSVDQKWDTAHRMKNWTLPIETGVGTGRARPSGAHGQGTVRGHQWYHFGWAPLDPQGPWTLCTLSTLCTCLLRPLGVGYINHKPNTWLMWKRIDFCHYPHWAISFCCKVCMSCAVKSHTCGMVHVPSYQLFNMYLFNKWIRLANRQYTKCISRI